MSADPLPFPSDRGNGLPLADAARALGITANAARKRAQRGTLPAARGADGLWYVWLADPDPDPDATHPTGQATGQAVASPPDALVAALGEEVSWLRSQLAAKDQTITALAARVADVADRLPALGSGPQGGATVPPSGQPATKRTKLPDWFIMAMQLGVVIVVVFAGYTAIDLMQRGRTAEASVLIAVVALSMTLGVTILLHSDRDH